MGRWDWNFGGDFAGDPRFLPRCSSVHPTSGVRCILDSGHAKEHSPLHKFCVPERAVRWGDGGGVWVW